jgi:hypothetical protein
MTAARIASACAAVLLVATAGIGFLHTPWGRPVLFALMPSCPVGFGSVLTTEERDAAHAAALSTVRGDVRAAGRPALGFALDTMTRAELDAWVAAHGLTCTERLTTRKCPAPAGTLPDRPEGELSFQLDAHDRLVAVTWEVTGLSAADSLALVDRAEASVLPAGPPTSTLGEPGAEWIAGGKLRQRSFEHRFVDYRAQLSATNVGGGRFRVREVYQSIPPGT